MSSLNVTIVNKSTTPLNFKKKTTGGINQNWFGTFGAIAPGASASMSMTGSITMCRGDLQYIAQDSNNVCDFHVAVRPNHNEASFSGSGVRCEFRTKISGGEWSAPGVVLAGSPLSVEYTIS